MGDTLNLFPARVAIGQADASGKVYLTPDFSRALATLLDRVGGPNGLGTEDLAVLVSAPLPARAPENALAQLAAPLPVGAHESKLTHLVAQLANLEALAARLHKLERALAHVAELASFRDPFRVDWERPGALGALTPNTVRGTTLESTVATGTPPLIVASTTNVPKLNASSLNGATFAIPGPIGMTTRDQAAFTKVGIGNNAPAELLDVSGNVRAYGGTFKTFGVAGTAKVEFFQNSGNWSIDVTGGYMQFNDMTSGVIRWKCASGRHLFNGAADDGVTAYQFQGSARITGGIGCNGKAPQPAAVLGAAATDATSTQTLVNNIRTALINIGIGS